MATATDNTNRAADEVSYAALAAGAPEDATETTNRAMHEIRTKAGEVASSVADKAKQAASTLGQKAEDATHAVGSGLKNLGETVPQKGPQHGVAGAAAASLADGLESGGKYLQQEGMSGMAESFTNVIRRNPIPALLVGVGLGFLLARVTMRR